MKYQHMEALNAFHQAVSEIVKAGTFPRLERAMKIAEVVITAAGEIAELASYSRNKSIRAFRKDFNRKPKQYNRSIVFKIWQRMERARIQAMIIASTPIPKKAGDEFNLRGPAMVGVSAPETVDTHLNWLHSHEKSFGYLPKGISRDILT